MGFLSLSDLGRPANLSLNLLPTEMSGALTCNWLPGLTYSFWIRDVYVYLLRQILLDHTCPTRSSALLHIRNDVQKANGPQRLSYRASGMPVSRVLGFGVSSAFSRAHSPATELHPSAAPTIDSPWRGNDGAASIKRLQHS